MLFIMCHFFVKAVVGFELVKAIYFSIHFTFRISAMRLFIFVNFFPLDLYTCNTHYTHVTYVLVDMIVFKNRVIVCGIKNSKNGSLWC